MQHLEVSGALRHIYVIRRLKVKIWNYSFTIKQISHNVYNMYTIQWPVQLTNQNSLCTFH